ncbi:hypothetical protein [Mesorhizobium sp. M0814]|uniref:hypothetical protein n=1 Tax=unclassified Mesorhizobium TaxID=325217 RepID=UPI00333BAAF8
MRQSKVYGQLLSKEFYRIPCRQRCITRVGCFAVTLPDGCSFAGRAVSLEQITNSLLFIPYLDTVTGYVQPVLGVGWTLNLEILFYILFAATMGFGGNYRLDVPNFEGYGNCPTGRHFTPTEMAMGED